MLYLKTFAFNPLMVNCYLVWNEHNEAMIVDPSCYTEIEQSQLLHYIKEKNLSVKYIVITHYHFDHVMGAAVISNELGVSLSIHKDYIQLAGNFDIHIQTQYFGFQMKTPPKPKFLLRDGDVLELGEDKINVIHVPGHSPCSIALYSEGNGFLISGDILFEGGIGRTDLACGNMELLLNGIKEKLFTLPETTEVYPGHGGATTIGDEKKFNTFIG
ncbi:MAG TPA: MBL fold metallo-hydrolase [Bacteroidales bacterium]|nr:MBL fold metallo-hydrolase [Bacteroidales bacterium]